MTENILNCIICRRSLRESELIQAKRESTQDNESIGEKNKGETKEKNQGESYKADRASPIGLALLRKSLIKGGL